ncbi:EAL domain-containing protein [Aeromonas veronii]|uniref:EAL domain-containing protein n=1 Tax=Aeromonas veronii TaxID=654 RepID=UPI001A8D7FF3|nr:EAL domain-containing protein [Aeromonas veronii]QSR46165.1 EAL domain-containing protein [Aeromonas veronii]
MLKIFKTPSFWMTLLLLGAPIALSQALAPLLATPLSHYLLEQKKWEIEDAMSTRSKELTDSITAQLAGFAFDCGPQDMELLRNYHFYNNHIRVQGIKLGSGGGCSSLGPDIPLNLDKPLSELKEKQTGLVATAARFNTEQEMVAYYRIGNNTAYWVLNNWSNTWLMTPCAYCFYIEHEVNAVVFPRGNSAIKSEGSSHSLTFTQPFTGIVQTLWAGKALEKYASQQTHLYGKWVGAALGLLLAGVYWLLRSYRSSLKGMLQTGLAKREFVPFYQPVVNSQTRQVVGFEALLRWQRGNELIPPGSFIEYAEEQELILPMTEQLLEQVITDLPQLAPEQWVSVNLVAAHIEQPLLRNLLHRNHNPSPAQLTFELTERKPILDIKAATEEISLLQQMGYHFKLDDFGTGYGGFAYLQSLGIRQIKIDKMFVDTIGTNDLKRSVLDAIIVFGRESGMEMIAEGVESQLQVDYLSQHGVYLIQGYFFGKPMPLKMLSLWQREWQLQHQKAS